MLQGGSYVGRQASAESRAYENAFPRAAAAVVDALGRTDRRRMVVFQRRPQGVLPCKRRRTPNSENGRTPILNEHPRPTMVRGNHTMLNGFWDYAIVSIPESGNGSKWRKSAAVLTRDEAVQAVKEAAIPETFDGKILVPFSPESALSGVHQTIYPDNMIWYRTVVHPVTLGGGEAVRQIGDANRLMLHFEAVDYVCACFINGQFAGMHVGGYLPFDVDISAFVDPDDAFEIALCVYDPNDSGTQMRGKQKIEREGIWYTAQSGIWQSVWLEIVPEAYLRTLTLKGTSDGKLFVRAEIGGDKPNAKLHIVVTDPADGTVVADETLPAGVRKVRVGNCNSCRTSVVAGRSVSVMTCGPNCDTGRRNPRKRRVMRRSRGRSRWMS